MNETPCVCVVEDDAVVRQSLAMLIETLGVEVKSFGTGREFLDHCDPQCCGCVVLDVRMPGLSGLEVQARMAERGLEFPVIFITDHGDVPMAVEAMRGGAVDFLQKPFDNQALISRVQLALERSRERRAEMRIRAEQEARLAGLSRRERQVLALLLDGRMNKRIASDLNISAKTVEDHRASIMKKTGARSLAELVQLAARTNAAPS